MKKTRGGQFKVDPNELIGKIFGKLKVVEFLGKTKGKLYSYNCICECGKITKTTRTHLITGNTKQCRPCKNLSQRKKIPGDAGFNHAYRAYLYAAISRNYEFNLTKDQFKEIVDKNCFYCNAEPSIKTVPNNKYGYTEESYNHAVYIHNGIDRIDNTNGYNINNCVPCCTICNRAKSTMTTEQFKNFIKRVYTFLKLE